MNFFDGPDKEEFTALRRRVAELEGLMYRVIMKLKLKAKPRERDTDSDTKSAS